MKVMKKLFTSVLLVFILSAHLFSATKINEKVAETPEMKIRMVLFVPADKSFPDNYMERYKELADYTEAFFTKWMNHWGYPCENPLKIERDEKEYPVVLVMKGEQNYDDYKDLKAIKKEVINQAKNKFNVPTENQVWWILNYPLRKRSSRGGGNVQNGGTSFGNYKDASGPIKIDAELASGVPEQINMKSLIHELTHALGLGHIGPDTEDNLGNSLMGPINRAYKKKYPDDSRVYLSEAAAAILWKHPLFSGYGAGKFKTPTVEVQNLKVNYVSQKKQLVVEGVLKSDGKAHSMVVLNASKGDRSPYWHKAFVGKVEPDGTFRCSISELKETGGELVIGFVFNNGAITGDGKKLGLNNSGIKKPYNYSDNKYLFN